MEIRHMAHSNKKTNTQSGTKKSPTPTRSTNALPSTTRQTTPAGSNAIVSVPRSTTASTFEAKMGKNEITRQAIAEAAYYLWLQRGGSEVSNWLDAENKLKK